MSLNVAKIISIRTIASPTRNPSSWTRSESRLSSYRFYGIEQKVAAIQQGNRKEIKQSDRDREYRRQMHQRHHPYRGYLSRNLSYPDWTTQLIGGFASYDNAAEIAHGALDHEPGFCHA